jgi:hypothetical protein
MTAPIFTPRQHLGAILVVMTIATTTLPDSIM